MANREKWVANARTARVPAVAWASLGWGAVVSIPTYITLGGFSLSAIVTILSAGTLLFLSIGAALSKFGVSPQHRSVVPARHSREPLWAGRLGHPWLPFALVAFVTICIGSLISGPSVDGVQNVCTYLIFALSIPVVVSRVSEHTPERFLHAAALVAGAVGTIALASTLIGFPLYDPRAFALASLVFLAVVIPSRSRHPLVRIAPYVLTGAVVVSLSRTATVIAILLLVFIVLRGRSGGRLIRAALLLSVAAAGVVVLWFSYAPFRERFTEGDNAVAINGVLINTSGRTAIWDVLLRNMGNSPLFGHGAGSASTAISAVYPSVGHPHNDYIRILYDFGWPGLCAFLVGYIVLIGWVARRAFGSPADAIHWSALIALIGIGLSALTDNAFVYPFVMFPLGVLVGLSVSRPVQRHSSYGRRNALHPRQHLTSMPVA